MEYHTNSCPCCNNKHESDDLFCNGCGFPLKGTQQEQDFFYSERNAKEIDLSDLNNNVESARKSLYWIAGLSVISFFVGYFTAKNEQDKFAILFTSVILIGAFLAFGVWSKTKPTAAMISGLSLYVIIHVINAIVDPVTIFSGIILKMIIIVYLIKGIRSVLEVDKLKKELNIN